MEEELPQTIEECHRLIRHLLSVIETMQAKIEELEARVNENSRNSNRPPSRDGFSKPKPAISKKKGRRGGQLQHSGKTLKRVAEPDLVVDCAPPSCQCGESSFVGEAEIVESRQVFDLPAPRLEVIEYRRLRRTCKCGKTVSGEFPTGILGQTQYGVKVQTLVALLSVQGCLSHRQIGQLFADLYGYEVNEATTQEMVKRTTEKMPMAEIKAGLLASAVVHFDETGIAENGKLKWLHNASSDALTYQYVHAKCGTEAMRSEPSLLGQFKGIAVHDCWASYFGFVEMTHAVCNAHLLRELTGIIEMSRSKWGRRMKQLLLAMYQKSEYGKGVIQEMATYEKRYEAILRAGEAEEPPPKKTHLKGKMKRTRGRNLLERMSKYKEAVLRFAKLEAVPFTNNQAARDIRAVKVKQKVSGGFRCQSGTESYTRIYSFISTMRKLKRQVFHELRSAIEGKPFVLFQT